MYTSGFAYCYRVKAGGQIPFYYPDLLGRRIESSGKNDK